MAKTYTEIKSEIASNITNKTDAKSITKTAVGGAINDLAERADVDINGSSSTSSVTTEVGYYFTNPYTGVKKTDSTTYVCAKFDVKKGDKVRLAGESTVNAALWAIVKDGLVVKSYDGGATAVTTPITIDVDVVADTFVFTSKSSRFTSTGGILEHTSIIEGVNDKIDNIKDDIDDINSTIASNEKRRLVSIPSLDADFAFDKFLMRGSAFGGEFSQSAIRFPLNSNGFNIRFKFKITSNALQASTVRPFFGFYYNNVQKNMLYPYKQVMTQQSMEFSAADGTTKTAHYPTMLGGIAFKSIASGRFGENPYNRSDVDYDFDNGLGEISFGVKYNGSVDDVVTISNDGSTFNVSVNGTTTSYSYTSTTSVSELITWLKTQSLTILCNTIESRKVSELVTFDDMYLTSDHYQETNGKEGSQYYQYFRDAATMFIRYSISNKWHQVEVARISNKTYISVDGETWNSGVDMNTDGETFVWFGSGFDYLGVLFKDIEVSLNDVRDAEIIAVGSTSKLISEVSPYIKIYEGHGLVDDATELTDEDMESNMSTTTDRLNLVFDTLNKKGYCPVTLYDIADYMNGVKSLPKRCYTIMFDDVRVNNYLKPENRRPFEKYGVKPATCVIVDKLSENTFYIGSDVATFDVARKVGEMVGFTHVSHTRNHRLCDRVKPSEVLNEFKLDTIACDKVGIDGGIIVYPGGRHNTYTKDCAEYLGFKMGISIVRTKYMNDRYINKYAMTREEIGVREPIANILTRIK